MVEDSPSVVLTANLVIVYQQECVQLRIWLRQCDYYLDRPQRKVVMENRPFLFLLWPVAGIEPRIHQRLKTPNLYQSVNTGRYDHTAFSV